MLDIRGAELTFSPGGADAHYALRGLSLRLERGEFVTVAGSNGAGKSTLFDAIAGSVRLDAGSITLDGADLGPLAEHKRARFIGRLFQDPRAGTAGGLTIEENMALVYTKTRGGFPLRRALTRKNRAAFRESLARLGMGLENRLKTCAGLLSGGQRQALTLLLATMTPPKLLLLDEHTAALDPESSRKVLALSAEIIARHKITALMITHNIRHTLEAGSRAIMLREGRVALDVSGEERARLRPEDVLERFRDS